MSKNVAYSTGIGRVEEPAPIQHPGPPDDEGPSGTVSAELQLRSAHEQLTNDCASLDDKEFASKKFPTSSWVSTAVSAANATSSKLSKASDKFRSFIGTYTAGEEKCSQCTSEDESSKNGSVREKLNNAWLSFKYANWKVKGPPRYEKEAPLWLLGCCYRLPGDDDPYKAYKKDEFVTDYRSRIWLTYRTDLSPFPGTSKTTDCGWGCMLRTCQMMLAQSITVLRLGRDWRFRNDDEANDCVNGVSHYDIVALFGDHKDCKLGLHRLMQIASESIENPVGSWYTPSMALSVMREALERTNSPIVGGLQLLCVTDGLLVRSESLIYLDPHIAQPAIPLDSIRSSWQRFHCDDVSKMPLEDVDPSCAFGILITSEDEYDSTIKELNSCGLIDVDAGTDGGLNAEKDDLQDAWTEGRQGTAHPIFSAVLDRPARFEGTLESHNAFLVAKAEEQGFELL